MDVGSVAIKLYLQNRQEAHGPCLQRQMEGRGGCGLSGLGEPLCTRAMTNTL